MAGPGELVDRRDAGQPVAAVDQGPRVAREAAGVAGDGDHRGQPGPGELPGLLFGAGARRVEDRGVEARQLLDAERPANRAAWVSSPIAAGSPSTA